MHQTDARKRTTFPETSSIEGSQQLPRGRCRQHGICGRSLIRRHRRQRTHAGFFGRIGGGLSHGRERYLRRARQLNLSRTAIVSRELHAGRDRAGDEPFARAGNAAQPRHGVKGSELAKGRDVQSNARRTRPARQKNNSLVPQHI